MDTHRQPHRHPQTATLTIWGCYSIGVCKARWCGYQTNVGGATQTRRKHHNINSEGQSMLEGS
eukprot:2488351-Alexandrium_andersonii.AAC.1